MAWRAFTREVAIRKQKQQMFFKRRLLVMVRRNTVERMLWKYFTLFVDKGGNWAGGSVW